MLYSHSHISPVIMMFCTHTDFTLHALQYMIQTNIYQHQVSPFLLTITTLMSQMIN